MIKEVEIRINDGNGNYEQQTFYINTRLNLFQIIHNKFKDYKKVSKEDFMKQVRKHLKL